MDRTKQNWLDQRVPRERRHEIARRIGELARTAVPDCIVADETPGNRLPLEVTFGVELYNVPDEKRSEVRQAVREYKLSLLKSEQLFIHVHISPQPPPAKATIVVGTPELAIAEEQASYRTKVN